jgi:hypothetical protein
MKIRLNSFVEEMVRSVDHVICRKRPSSTSVPLSLRMLIVARSLVNKGLAEKQLEPDRVELWTPCRALETQIGNSNIAIPVELDFEPDFTHRRDILLYVAAVNAEATDLLTPELKNMVADVIAFNKGYSKMAGWDKSGRRKWEQTPLGRKMEPSW